jgi:hypothetical protein
MATLEKRLDAVEHALAPNAVVVLREDDSGKRYLFDSDEGAPPLLPCELAELERTHSHVIIVRYVDMSTPTTS